MRIPQRQSLSLKLFFSPVRTNNRVRVLLTVSVTLVSMFAGAWVARKASMDAVRVESSAPAGTNRSSPELPKAGLQPIVQSYLRRPLAFEANQGQTAAQVRFLSRGSGYNLYLTPTEAVMTLRKEKAKATTLGNQPTQRDLAAALDPRGRMEKGTAHPRSPLCE